MTSTGVSGISSLTVDAVQKDFFKQHREEIIKSIKQPSHLISELYFSADIIYAITEKENHSAQDAARMMCDELLKSTYPNWFHNFKQTLLKHGYEKLYKLLSLDLVKDGTKYDLLVQNFCPRLIDVTPDDIIPTLHSKGLLTKSEMENLDVVQKTRSPTIAMLKLLCILPKTENWFFELLEALKEAKYHELIRNINSELLTAGSNEEVSMLVGKMYMTPQSVKKQSPPKAVAVVPPTPQPATFHDGSVETPLKSPDCDQQSSTDCKILVGATYLSPSVAETPVKQLTEADIVQLTSQLGIATRDPGRGESQGRRDTETTVQRLEMERVTDRYCPANDDDLLDLDLRSNCPASAEQPDSYDFDRRSVSTTMTDGQPSSSSVFTPTRTAAEEEKRSKATRGSPKDAPREPLELRGYQQELAADALRGENCLIVAPTGCGKTHVALAVAKHVYDNATLMDDPKIAFFVPTVALVSQQLSQFNKYMNSSCRCIGLSGDEDVKLSLKDLVEVNDVLIMTPQILLNALNNNVIESLSVFSLLIFDECHRMTKNHPYNDIMSKYYVDLLLNQDKAALTFQLPQVIGLTASPGVGQANSLEKAVQYILQLCANMSATKISTVRDPKNWAELARYENKPTEDTEEVRGRQYDPFADLLQDAMLQIENRIRQRAKDTPQLVMDIPNIHQLIAAPALRGSDPYVQFVSKLKKHIAVVHDQAIRKCFVACLRHLEVYNNALLINADYRTKDALNYIDKEFEQFQYHRGSLAYDDTDVWLEKLFTDMLGRLREASDDPRNENPKLKKIQELITNFHRENQNSQGIIFCKTREMTAAMVNWIKETTELAWLNPHHLVGANKQSQSAATGMTHNKLEDVLKYFKGGEHKIIVATSVAEEGLDVKSCNYVIRYEHVTNDIARIQARGRARAGDAQYVLVAEPGRGTIVRDEANRLREKMMNEAIKNIDVMKHEQIKESIRELQIKSKVERDMEAQGKLIGESLRKARSHEGDYELRCLHCDALCTWSSDLRTIQQVHRITVDEDFKNRILLRPHPLPKKYGDWEKKAKIDCVKCRHDWGIKAVYRSVPYHVLKVESLVLIGPHGEREHCKKWKNIPFHVQELSLEDMQQMSKKALGNDV